MNRSELSRRIDHTLLRPEATADRFGRLCDEAIAEGFASVCVPPNRVGAAAQRLSETDVAVATVIDFPHGASPRGAVVAQAAQALEDGAVELDVVMPIGRFLDGAVDEVTAHLAAVVATARPAGAIVKVIIETGLLGTDERKATAVEVVVRSGADYVKTSTGFNTTTGATVEDVRLLVAAARGRARVKASGGIADLPTALALLEAGADRLGCSRSVAIVAGLGSELA